MSVSSYSERVYCTCICVCIGRASEVLIGEIINVVEALECGNLIELAIEHFVSVLSRLPTFKHT